MTTNQFPLIGSPLLAREVRGHRHQLQAVEGLTCHVGISPSQTTRAMAITGGAA